MLLFKRILISLIFSCLILPMSLMAGDKVVLIVNGSDNDYGNLRNRFNQSSDYAATVYRDKGYRVIFIESDKGMGAEDFRKKLSELKNVDEVTINFFTHGIIQNEELSFSDQEPLNTQDLKRFPKSYLRPDEVDLEYGKKDLKSTVRFAYAMFNNENIDKSANANWIGLGDLHDSLILLKNSNPKVQVNITSLSCFGSNATRSLQDIPGVQVFTGGAASQSSIVFTTREKLSKVQKKSRELPVLSEAVGTAQGLYEEGSDFARYFLQELSKGKTYLESFSAGRKIYLEEKLNTLNFYQDSDTDIDSIRAHLVRPQSSMELLLADECLGKPPRTEVTPYCYDIKQSSSFLNNASDILRPILTDYISKELTSDTQYLNKMYELLNCEEQIAAKETEALRKSFIAARDEMKEQLESITQSDFDNALEKLQEKLDLITKAKNPEELRPLIENKFSNKVIMENLESIKSQNSDRENKLFFERAKFYLHDQTKNKIDDLKGIGDLSALAFLKKSIKNHFSEKLLNGNSFLKCLEIPLSCKINDVLWEEFNQSRLPIDISDFDFLSETLIVETCPSTMDRAKQLNCINNHTNKSHRLRAYSLSKANFILSKEDRKQSCRLFSLEKDRNENLNRCLKSEKFGNSDFWEKMNSLYVQGENNLTSK